MKYFKIRAARTAKRYKITPFEFLEITKRKFPFEQVTEHEKLSQYGICPSCLNPIQLIGVVKGNRWYSLQGSTGIIEERNKHS